MQLGARQARAAINALPMRCRGASALEQPGSTRESTGPELLAVRSQPLSASSWAPAASGRKRRAVAKLREEGLRLRLSSLHTRDGRLVWDAGRAGRIHLAVGCTRH